uniref:Uncharacterized protein n=1 Tax=Rhizophora mucronata TaxID=61149 RepID=A0A2P2NEC3_RHIMU
MLSMLYIVHPCLFYDMLC